MAVPGTIAIAGEAYLTTDDTTLAVKNYRKSLALNPENTNAEKVLKRLLGR